MPRAKLNRRLSDADAIRQLHETHIVKVRRRKDGEIVSVKHVTFGWISPQFYYGLQKIHDIGRDFGGIIGPVLQGGYQLKWALANASIGVEGFAVPLGGSFYAGAIGTALILLRGPAEAAADLAGPLADIIDPTLQADAAAYDAKIRGYANEEAGVLLAGVFLPFGELLLLWAMIRIVEGKTFLWSDLWSDIVGGAVAAGIIPGAHPGVPFGPEGPGGHFPGPHPGR